MHILYKKQSPSWATWAQYWQLHPFPQLPARHQLTPWDHRYDTTWKIMQHQNTADVMDQQNAHIPCARQDWSSVQTRDTCWLLLTSRSCTSTASTATLNPQCRCLPRCRSAGSNLKTSTTDQTCHKFICLPKNSPQTTKSLGVNRQNVTRQADATHRAQQCPNTVAK